MIKYVIAIDPGVNTGIGIFSVTRNELVLCQSFSFWDAIETIEKWIKEYRDVVDFIVENPNNKAVWRNGKNKPIQNRMARNVGSVLRDANLIIEYIQRKGYLVTNCHPVGKLDQKKFALITGWQEKTNQHGRDAGMMAFNHGKNLVLLGRVV
jgi:hypothetical protein